MKVNTYFIGLLVFRNSLSPFVSTNNDFDSETSQAILYRFDARGPALRGRQAAGPVCDWCEERAPLRTAYEMRNDVVPRPNVASANF
jgi:hypothetical protein